MLPIQEFVARSSQAGAPHASGMSLGNVFAPRGSYRMGAEQQANTLSKRLLRFCLAPPRGFRRVFGLLFSQIALLIIPGGRQDKGIR
jgi:hypothetical protein